MRVVVVGAGAAGIFAAWRAAQCGAEVILLEKTLRLGTKILISGGGKCNITHDGPIEELIRAFRPNEGRFLRPSFYRFRNDQVVEMLTSRGLRVYTRSDGRIFPLHGTAKDVVAILRGYLEEARVDLRFGVPVTDLSSEGGRVVGVETCEGRIEADAVVVAAGGSSYPNAGTTGDAWPWLRALGHSVVKVRAALAPLYLRAENHDPALSGVAVGECVLRTRGLDAGGKRKGLVRWYGDLLFTHQGVSGPCALGVSREVAEAMERGEVEGFVDFLPSLKQEVLDAGLSAWQKEHPKRKIGTLIEEFVPARLAPRVAEAAGLDPEGTVWGMTGNSRRRLAEILKGFPLGAIRTVPLEKGEVVAGGVCLEEVDPHTLASRLRQGLYLCGEVLDIAGPVGGYNLQAAFSTGYVAGESAANGLAARTG
jgi:predicted Rossmann fold flavoprotein